MDCCNYADSTECIDKYYRYLNKDEAENPSKSRHKFKTKGIMKKYSKPQMIAKNIPTGSYAAGCQAHDRNYEHYPWNCVHCERQG